MRVDLDYLTNFEMFLLSEKRVSKNTFSAYKKDIEQLLEFLKNEKTNLKSCDKNHLKNFLRHLRKNGATPKTVSRKISTMKLFFTFLNENFDLEDKGKALIFPKLEQTLPIYLTEEEIEILFKIVNEDNSFRGIRNKVMFSLMYATGVRVSELVNMRINQVEFETGFIKVEGKGSKERMIPVPQSILSLLKYYLENIYEKLISKKNKLEKRVFLFPISYKNQVKPISRQIFWGVIKNLIAISGIKKNIFPHSLRHSVATHLLRKGANIRLLQELLGHENLTTIQVYTHLEDSHLRNIYDKKHPRS